MSEVRITADSVAPSVAVALRLRDFPLLFIGGLVTSKARHRSRLADQLRLQYVSLPVVEDGRRNFYEHSHRLVASTVIPDDCPG